MHREDFPILTTGIIYFLNLKFKYLIILIYKTNCITNPTIAHITNAKTSPIKLPLI